MANHTDGLTNQYRNYIAPRPQFLVGGYRGPNYITVNTTLPTNPRLVDHSRLPNGRSPAEYANLFSRLPQELDAVLKSKGHAEVSITIDEKGRIVPKDSGSREATHATYISAMIKRNPDGTNSLLGIWGGQSGGGNNGVVAAMSTIKLMSTQPGRTALGTRGVLDAAEMNWGQTTLASAGPLSRNPRGWEFADGGKSTSIHYTQTQSYGVPMQTGIVEHHSEHNTWGCIAGTDESFRARLNARMAVMMGGNTRTDAGNGLGLQNTASAAARVFAQNRALAGNMLGRIYQLNPVMFDTGNPRYANLAQQLNVQHTSFASVTRTSVQSVPLPLATAPAVVTTSSSIWAMRRHT